MSQDFGIPSHTAHLHAASRPVSRYLVVIGSGGDAVARLFDAQRRQVAEFDASTEEVAVMLRGLVPAGNASAADWDSALTGHSAPERAAAEVYTLDV